MTEVEKLLAAWPSVAPADRPAFEARLALLRERRGGDDDHFYGAWNTGGGGRGAPQSQKQLASLKSILPWNKMPVGTPHPGGGTIQHMNAWGGTHGEYGGPGNPAAILPTDSSINLKKPDGNWLYDSWSNGGANPEQAGSALVMFKMNDTRTRPTRIVMGSGGAESYKLGQEMHFAHDQTRAYMGHYKIVGIKDFKNGIELGDIPDRKIKMQVFK